MDHDDWCPCEECLEQATADAQELMGDGLICTSRTIYCACPDCRAHRLALAAERAAFDSSMKAAAAAELEDLLDQRDADPEARLAAFEAMGGGE